MICRVNDGGGATPLAVVGTPFFYLRVVIAYLSCLWTIDETHVQFSVDKISQLITVACASGILLSPDALIVVRLLHQMSYHHCDTLPR